MLPGDGSYEIQRNHSHRKQCSFRVETAILDSSISGQERHT